MFVLPSLADSTRAILHGQITHWAKTELNGFDTSGLATGNDQVEKFDGQ